MLQAIFQQFCKSLNKGVAAGAATTIMNFKTPYRKGQGPHGGWGGGSFEVGKGKGREGGGLFLAVFLRVKSMNSVM